MRKSRIYLGLGIVSLAAAFFVAELSRICPHIGRTDSCAHGNGRASRVPGYGVMYGHAISGRYEKAIQCANRRLAADPHDSESRLYLAYSLRGAGNLDQAGVEYTAALEDATRRGASANWIAIDALTGRAACRLASPKSAESDLLTAKLLAVKQESEQADARTAYQLACLHAQLAAVYDTLKMRHSRKVNTAEALRFLQTARDRGYNKDHHIENDLDLAPVRGSSIVTAQMR